MSRRQWLVGAGTAYAAVLAWVILWKLQVPYVGDGTQRVIKLMPYLPAGGEDGSNPVEVGLNVVLFVPVGGFCALLAPRWSWMKQLGILAGGSLILEVAQFALATGRSDITDVIDNSMGGLLGVVLVAVLRRRLRTRADGVAARALYVATGIGLIVALLLVLSPLRFHDPHR